MVKEEFVGDRYIISYVSDDSFPLLNAVTVDSIDVFTTYSDLFIAIPPQATPKVNFKALKQQAIEYKYSSTSNFNNDLLYLVKGFLWIDNYYCIHLEVHPYKNIPSAASINKLIEFKIELQIPRVENTNTFQLSKSFPTSITNPQYGKLWRAEHPTYTLSATDEWINYSYDYLKIGVAQDGIYRLTKSDLIPHGIPVNSLNPKKLKIFLKGKEIPIYVKGESDNSFDEDDFVEFLGRRNYGDIRYRQVNPYGTSYYEYLDIYSDTTMYWLSWDGSNGLRADTTLILSGIPSDTTRYYDNLLRREFDVYWDFSLNPGGLSAELRKNFPDLLENETWHEGTLGIGTSSVSFTVSNLFPNKPARAFAKLQDYASSISTNAHNIALSINSASTKYDSGFINKYQVKVLEADFAVSALKNGTNTVTIHSFSVPGNSVNNVIRDWYELEYPRYLSTTNDSLSFGYRNLNSPFYSMIAISGVNDSSFSLYKFTQPDSGISKITNYNFVHDTVYFADSIKADSYYFLLSDSKIPSPIIFYKKKFINLRSSVNKADYIAITHPYFQSAAANYVSFISSTYSITTKLVDINDICDEYNYGFWSPKPIKEFLKSTQEFWQSPTPKSVFLIGKGTYDYYGNKLKYAGVPRVPNFIPPYGNPVSDNWFVLWDTTNALIPQMSIGRLPVTSIDEFQSYFSKHQKYVAKGFDEWNKRYLFYSGGNFKDSDDVAEINQFKGINDQIINNYVLPAPVGGSIANFYKTTKPITNFGPYSQEYIQNAVEQGGMFISYIGHSGTDTWDNSITSVTQLVNVRDRSPMISDFGCSTGKHAEPDILSFSEKAVCNLEGQAISYIGNSSLGFTSTALTFPQVFYKTLLVDTSASLGDVHRLAKIAYSKQHGNSEAFGLFIKTNSLIGDPIVTLPIPTKPNFTFSNTTIKISPDRPTEKTDSVSISITYYNLGKVFGDSLEIVLKDEFQGNVVFIHTMKRKVPIYRDSLTFTFRVKDKPGVHIISAELDPNNILDEIYKNDNRVTYNVLVASTNIRNLTSSTIFNQTNGKIVYLNPSVKSSQTSFFVDISLNNLFEPKNTYQVAYDTFFTKFIIDTTYYGKRIWIRSRLDESNLEGLAYSYVVGNKDNYLFQDSIALKEISLTNLKISNQKIILDSSKIVFSVESGGFNDGNTAIISKDNQNFIPTGLLRGFHVAYFDNKTYGFKGYYRFDIQAGGTIAANFKNLLDTLPSNNLLMVAVSNDVASNLSLLTADLKTSLKQYGSIFIDSVRVADSWALIGKKGAIPGTVPEKYLKRYNGNTAKIDSTIHIPIRSGTFLTPEFGPVAKWNDIEFKHHINSPDSIMVQLIGTKNDAIVDTLINFLLTDSIISISNISAQQYPALRIGGEITLSEFNIPPTISLIAINYDAFPELGTNYQSVKVNLLENGVVGKAINSADTLLQGEKLKLTYRIYNAGGSTARNVASKVVSVWENNYSEQVANFSVDSIPPLSYKEVSADYNTALGFGKRNLQFIIDPDTVVKEIYKDNNYFVFPIIVKKNQNVPVLPNLAITQEGILPALSAITDETDSVLFKIGYQNNGAVINDSITISIKHLYRNTLTSEWLLRRKYPSSTDTISIIVPILRRPGEHQIKAELDPFGLVFESSESDNLATYYFSVSTTVFRIVQPNQFTSSSFQRMLFLNPTESFSQSIRIALLDIDTIASFSSTQSYQIPMQEFTTTHNISALQKNKRYYWRIKEQGSPRDWTAGTFYLGVDSMYSLGQSDSIGWSNNTYNHAVYRTPDGAQIEDTKYLITLVSKGFNAGASGSAIVNDVNIIAPILGTGHNIAVMDTVNFSVIGLKRFDVSNNPSDSDSLEQFIASIPLGRLVIDVIVDDGSNNLLQSARNALKTIGSAYIDQLGWRDSWAIIGKKGAIPGSVPESLKPQSTEAASVESTITKKEYFGKITTPLLGTISGFSDFNLIGTTPIGTNIKAKFIGNTTNNTIDTIQLYPQNLSVVNKTTSSTDNYTNARILFELTTTNKFTPSIQSWSIGLKQPTELAVSAKTTSLDRSQVMIGESITFFSKIYNLGVSAVESSQVVLKTTHQGIITLLQQTTLTHINSNDSIEYTYTYDTRNKKGDYAFILEIIPRDTINEINSTNNSITLPFVVLSDSIKPKVRVTFDGREIVDGDYISRYPTVMMYYTDNNLSQLFQSDTNNFTIKLNNDIARYTPGVTELIDIATPGRAEIRWTPVLPKGENFIEFFATDISGNYSDSIRYYVNVDSVFKLLDVYNIPNPFKGSTHFTFNLAGPISPDEVIIKLYTVAGRLIHEIHSYANIGFNKILWDGRDKDGDEIGNGVYLYKVIVKGQDAQATATSKLVKMK